MLSQMPGRAGRLFRLARQYLDIRRALQRNSAPASLPFLSIESTTTCNASCGMCGYPTHYPLARPPLDTAAMIEVIDQAAELGTLLISLGGGEPFMRPDTETLIDRITGHGITALVHSNGSLLTDARIRRLAGIPKLVLSLSLDSPFRHEHDAVRGVACFDRVIAASVALSQRSSRARATWICTITRRNLDRLPALITLAGDIGVRTVRFTLMHDNLQHRYKPPGEFDPFRLTEDDVEALRAQVGQILALSRQLGITTNSPEYLNGLPAAIGGRVPHRCQAGHAFAVMDPAGQLMPCYDLSPGPQVGADLPLAEAWHGERMNALRQDVRTCQRQCWNIGTAEPSLRLTPGKLHRQIGQLAREAFFFLR